MAKKFETKRAKLTAADRQRLNAKAGEDGVDDAPETDDTTAFLTAHGVNPAVASFLSALEARVDALVTATTPAAPTDADAE